MKTFEVRIAIEHMGDGNSSVPARMQPDFVSALEQSDPKPRKIDWSDMRRSNQTVVVYDVQAENQFDAMAAGKEIFEKVFRPRLEHFQTTLGSLEAEETGSSNNF